jgi:hypothetical protein
MEAIYRGGGPDKGRFDFTAAYFEIACQKPGIPEAFLKTCKAFRAKYEALTSEAVYCLNEPNFEGCEAKLATAKAAKEADQVLYDECKSLGEKAFNKKYQSDVSKQRSLECAYEKKGTGGPNTKGQTWRRLLPAACFAGSFVDRSGLDCCDGNKMSLGGFGNECAIYIVKKP